MRIPTLEGVIDRRVLVNFRIDPEYVAAVLPAPFRPQLVDGYAIGGICLIRLVDVRPDGWPKWMTVGSENAAHRIAVEWGSDGQTEAGVYIPRRDSSSRLNVAAGSRVFPGVHHRADFTVVETDDHYDIRMVSRDGGGSISVVGDVTHEFPAESVFPNVDAASAFFEAGSLGYSPRRDSNFDGLELETTNWSVRPLDVTHVDSSFFGDLGRFPAGTATFDDALLMRGIDHRWHQRPTLCAC